MARGQKAQVGDTRTAPNGYHYTRTEDGWRLTHHIVWEEANPDEPKIDSNKVRVSFKDGNPRNYNDPDNIVVKPIRPRSASSRRAQLEAKIQDLEAELAALPPE